jgi:hypothetical protein
METMAKRSYTRRSDEDRIAALAAKIQSIKTRMEMKERKDSPVLREMVKVQRMLRKFAQTAQDCGRGDIATSTQAFVAGLERTVNSENDEVPRRRRRSVASLEEV